MGLLLCRKQKTRWRLRRPATCLAIAQWEAMCGGHEKNKQTKVNKKTEETAESEIQTCPDDPRGEGWQMGAVPTHRR